MAEKSGIYRIFLFALFILFSNEYAVSQSVINDSIHRKNINSERYNSFYDSLKARAEHKKITKFIHHLLFTNPKSGSKKDSLNIVSPFEGKVINQIKIIRLDVFGPTLMDTSRKAKLWYEKAGNLIHTRSDLHNIRKNLIFSKGDQLKTSELYENERLLRALPYIRDVRFFVESDSLNNNLVNVILLTQDRFSIGISGKVNAINSANLEIYNRNIFGVGHELSARFVGHLTREPFMGIETFYKIHNISGKFISFSAGYMNTFQNEGALMVLDKDFLRISDKWGYGVSGYLFKRTYQLPGEPIPMNPELFGYFQYGGWAGKNFQAGKGTTNSQLTLSGQFIHRHFSSHPPPLPNGEQYYRGTNLYLTGLTWSKRIFKPDELIYSYGITEDIPKGFKYELVLGYDDNEYGSRLYSHIYLANGNLINKKPGHLFLEAGLSGYFKPGKTEQGMAEFSSIYISPLFSSGTARFRQFLNINYRLGINRLETEKLYFEKNNFIRGFRSNEVYGKQRLSISAETVYFQRRDFYRFNLAFFTFVDIGILRDESSWIFRGQLYSGLGIGLRLRNESLLLKTLQIRLTFYPNHPEDVGFLGFILNEQTRQTFNSFQPGPPLPRKFE